MDDSLRRLVAAALADFGDEVRAEAVRLERVALDRPAPCAEQGGFALLELNIDDRAEWRT
jgi:hypothetical protein